MSGGLSGASGYSRGPSGASWGLRLLPGALWGLLGPPVTPGGPLGPPGASGYSRGSLGPPGASGYSRGPSGASWGLRLLPGGPFLPAKPIWRWCGSVRVGAPLGSAGKKRAAPRRSFLSTPARGGERRRPAAGVRPPLGLVPSLNIVKKSGGVSWNLHCGCGIVRSTLGSRCGSRFRGCGNVSAR